jgi:nucleotide-binding universal stress UspA family protein
MLAVPHNRAVPIVAAIDGSPASWHAIDAAVRLAVELNAALMFVYVRRGRPASSERRSSSAA